MNEIELKVVGRTDDTFLAWRVPRLESCIGFAIERQWRAGSPAARTLNQSEYL
jgi:hypothetical protein